MGDNIYLGDRDTVRTPMQWTPDRNAGFSTADFAQLFLPPLMDPVYGYASVNVEASTRDPSSFLHWLQRMIAVRRQLPVFATGSIEVLSADNPSVLVYLRTTKDPVTGGTHSVVCVNNLSRFAQATELSLVRWRGTPPVELIGRSTFPPIGLEGYRVTLGPHGFFWLQVEGR
jgi:maltose alpha-D-glucosyltransferase/alpha-amylase